MNIFDKLLLACFIAALIGLMICSFMLIKNENTGRNRLKIIHAIAAYEKDCILGNRTADWRIWDAMEDYDATLYRLWDWGYTRILPPEKFELIKDYIKEN